MTGRNVYAGRWGMVYEIDPATGRLTYPRRSVALVVGSLLVAVLADVENVSSWWIHIPVFAAAGLGWFGLGECRYQQRQINDALAAGKTLDIDMGERER